MGQKIRGSTSIGRLVSGAVTGLFLAYLVTLSPHLVHHLFDQDHGRPACPHLAQSQNTPALEASPVTLTLPNPTEIVLAFAPQVSPAPAEIQASGPRAPPSLFLSA